MAVLIGRYSCGADNEAPFRPGMPLPLLRSLIWLDYRLAVLFAVALPLVLLFWALSRREQALVRLLTLYWQVASLLGITVLLMVDARPVAYITSALANLFILIALWFWSDLNEELADLPPYRPLPLTVRCWRWAMTVLCVLGLVLTVPALGCAGAGVAGEVCQLWLEAPQQFHDRLAVVLSFLFGGSWTATISAFLGYLGLAAYGVGLIQFLVVRLPKQGRLAGGF